MSAKCIGGTIPFLQSSHTKLTAQHPDGCFELSVAKIVLPGWLAARFRMNACPRREEISQSIGFFVRQQTNAVRCNTPFIFRMAG